MSKFFINRPIVAMVISIIMVIAGAVSYIALPVAQYPDIVPPAVQVSTAYVGADAMTVEQSVAAPIEQQISGVDNMEYVESINSSDGTMSMNVNFAIGTDPNTDQLLTQMREGQALASLPSDVSTYGVSVQKATSSPLLLISLVATDPDNKDVDAKFLANHAYIFLNDALLRIPGIGQVSVFGAGKYAMRIWLRPNDLARYNLTVTEVMAAVQEQNTVNPVGSVGGEPIPAGQANTYTMRTQGRLASSKEFDNIIIRAKEDGSVVRLKDVASTERGVQTYSISSKLNGQTSAAIAVYQLPGSNAVETVKMVRKFLKEYEFPAGVDYKISLDTTKAITEGLDEIKETLFEAILLVIVVVFIFLQGFRATLIPLMAVPVSLVGTFALFPLLGFSVNTLSLFGLVLAIGIVVDDAIVVVEAVEKHIEEGLSPKDATIKAMEEVSGPVVAIALILVSVFVPTVFIPGITGRLYQQFAVTIAVSTVLSAFNALTLSPALAAMLLKPKKEHKGVLASFFGAFNRCFGVATSKYVTLCHFLIRKSFVSLILIGAMVFGIMIINGRLAPSFLPEEDQGYYFVNVSLPAASSLQKTESVTTKINEFLTQIPGVEFVTTINGYSMLSGTSTPYSAFFFVALKEWSQRKAPEEKYEAILRATNMGLFKLQDELHLASALAFSPPAIPGIGTAGGVSFLLEDRGGKDIEFLANKTQEFIQEAQKRPEIAYVSTTLAAKVPQILTSIDREKVLKQGIDLGEVYRTLQVFMGGTMLNYYNEFGRQWSVYLQADGNYRKDIKQLNSFYVRNKAGDAVPLSTICTSEMQTGPEFTLRHNLYRSAQINAMAKPGYSSMQVMQALEEVFSQVTTPSDSMGFDYSGMSLQEKKAREGISSTTVFAFSFVFVFLLLAALYESWSLPVSVLLGVPIAIFGAFLGLWIRGMENDIYAQIGMVVLIGLAAKNAILIVEFAKAENEKGKAPVDAALTAAELRLRPILMTAFAFILGCLPLVNASGAGSVSRQILGTAVVAGMLTASLIAIFVIPCSFYLVKKLFR